MTLSELIQQLNDIHASLGRAPNIEVNFRIGDPPSDGGQCKIFDVEWEPSLRLVTICG
jgi:hypothetical protein